MDKKVKVCHFTSAHEQLDDRIYLKECTALVEAGYDVFLVASGDSKDESGVHIVGCGMPEGRRDRMTRFAKKVYERAKALDCDIYHFHDPELLPYGIKLKRKGKKVIFDSHEDIPAQIRDKEWLPGILQKPISFCYKCYESFAVKKFDGVITATKHIAEQFQRRAKQIEIINNYPRLDDILFHDNPFDSRQRRICYAGGIDAIRGEKVMIAAVEDTDVRLTLAGPWSNPINSPNVEYLGKITRRQVDNLYASSIAGILLYQPAENHYDSQPIKMFEYMAAGLPIICSNFSLWKSIIEENECGICVNPQNSDEVREAIKYIVRNISVAQEMGKRGYEAVKERFNWNIEKEKLLRFYQAI